MKLTMIIVKTVDVPDEEDCSKCSSYERTENESDNYGVGGFSPCSHWCRFFNVNLNYTTPCWDCRKERRVKMENHVGLKVEKKSHKPFKSGKIINTIKGITINNNTGKVAYTFFEDDSVVDAHQCIVETEQTQG
jgi:hypothetical protein